MFFKYYINFYYVFRKSTVKCESSPEPDTTESEASSKNDLYNNSFFTASKKNKQLFVKILKRACVVCKNYDDTIKCMGPCQSYFHKKCLSKSEERYHKSEPMIKLKKTGKRTKKHYSKSKKLKNLNSSNPKMIESNSGKLSENDDSLVPVSVSTINSDFDGTIEEDKLHNQPKSDDLSTNIKYIPPEDDNIQQISKLEKVTKESIKKISDKKIVDTLIKSTNEFENESKNICNLCEANKINCFLCGLHIEDTEQKVVCKLSKLNIFNFVFLSSFILFSFINLLEIFVDMILT